MLEVEIVAEGFALPEGPVALADGSVLLCEVMRGAIARVSPSGEVARVAETGGGPNGAAIGPDGLLYLCNNGGGFRFEQRSDGIDVTPDAALYVGGSIQTVDIATGRVETLYTHSDGRPLIAPNDLVFDSGGGLWFTDFGASTTEGRTYGAIHYAPADGSGVVCCRRGIASPNGIGLSPDGRTLYAADTLTSRLWAFDIVGPGQLAPGPAHNKTMPGRLIQTLSGYQLLDSLAVEADGRICVGTLLPGGVSLFDPSGATEFLATADQRITNLCFGGADMRDVWLTGANAGRLYRARWPRPGLRLHFNA